MKLYDRWVEIYFEETADGVSIIAHFDFETENPLNFSKETSKPF